MVQRGLNQRDKKIEEVRKDHQEQINGLKLEVAQLTSVDKAKSNYIGELRNHIWEQKPPPPPPWPDELLPYR